MHMGAEGHCHGKDCNSAVAAHGHETTNHAGLEKDNQEPSQQNADGGCKAMHSHGGHGHSLDRVAMVTYSSPELMELGGVNPLSDVVMASLTVSPLLEPPSHV